MAGVTDSRPALAGVTVLDLATFLAAPLCATFLGEFGAEVIKVEQPGVGDDLRRLGASAGGSGSSYWWFVEARNKKSITCNLRDPEGQALIRRLVASTDVVAENFRPGTLERWNLGWDELSRVRPSLVMVRISAFGQTGPNRARPGFGRIAAAVGGLAYLSGYPDRAPVSPGTPTVPDYLAGVFGAVGALAALRHAERTGEGQVVDLALYEPVLRVFDDAIAVYGGTGHVRERIGSGTESAVPHNHYQSRDQRWIAIACTNDRMFRASPPGDGPAGPHGRSAHGDDTGAARPPGARGRGRRRVGRRARRGKGTQGAGGGGGARLARRERARPLRGLPRARAPEHRVGRAAPARPARDAGSRPAVD